MSRMHFQFFPPQVLRMPVPRRVLQTEFLFSPQVLRMPVPRRVLLASSSSSTASSHDLMSDPGAPSAFHPANKRSSDPAVRGPALERAVSGGQQQHGYAGGGPHQQTSVGGARRTIAGPGGLAGAGPQGTGGAAPGFARGRGGAASPGGGTSGRHHQPEKRPPIVRAEDMDRAALQKAREDQKNAKIAAVRDKHREQQAKEEADKKDRAEAGQALKEELDGWAINPQNQQFREVRWAEFFFVEQPAVIVVNTFFVHEFGGLVEGVVGGEEVLTVGFLKECWGCKIF